MSANNQLIIIKKKEKYQAFDIDVECEDTYESQTRPSKMVWEASTLDEAVRLAEKYTRQFEVEYGYTFIGDI